MSVFNYRKFKVALSSDSKKTQGLRVGDIVRRQYFDGTNIVYSLMCVTEIGIDVNEQPYFIGSLLEGDAPQASQILDFARITNLFDTDRSGALYLTANDSNAPYMDIIDGIGRNASLCWPTGLAIPSNPDSQSQYILSDAALVTAEYIKTLDEHSRVLHLTKNNNSGVVTLKQDFYKYVANPNRVIVSYKIKSTKAITGNATIGYVDETKTDGSVNINISDEWSYQLHIITVDWSGRHLRSVKLSLPGLEGGDEVWIADFNVILLSSIAQFGDSSQMRVGKLDGITDKVFGKISGYGAYLQKVYSSGSAHISGTLTAGDKDGFGATFYAGRIHRNAFRNSIEPSFLEPIEATMDITNPVGVGNVYKLANAKTINVQSASWLMQRIGNQYCFSFWAFANNPCNLVIAQNGNIVGIIQIDSSDTHNWHRHYVKFNLLQPALITEALKITISPSFSAEVADAISNSSSIVELDTKVVYEDSFYFSSPQLESGVEPTQYQPTDEILEETEDFGAWFNRGGIGGTIQNPLLKLNFDGSGSIGTRTNSFLLRPDGSGFFANQNIRWNEFGHVTFGENVTLNWDNIDSSSQRQINSKSVKIAGNDTMVVVRGGNAGLDAYNPSSLKLSISTSNFSVSEGVFQWQYMGAEDWVNIAGANGTALEVFPTDNCWDENDSAIIRICATALGSTVYDTISLKKIFVFGYTVEITSEKGTSFHNGACETTLKATLYYRGTPVTNNDGKFIFAWHKYSATNPDVEDTTWYQQQLDGNGNVIRQAIDTSASEIHLNYAITDQDIFTCSVSTTNMFTYDFPISF